jgi:uncharacterized membrane protein
MVKFIEPLSDSVKRMSRALFKPFDIKKWFIVGFTAFLAGMMDCTGSKSSFDNNRGNFTAEDFFNFPYEAKLWLAENPLWAVLIFIGIFLIFILIIVLTYLSSRGKFMFLDNVVNDAAEVSAPWSEYQREANWLFLWRFAFGMGLLIFFSLIIYIGFNTAFNIYQTADSIEPYIPAIIISLLILLPVFIIFGYIDCFLENFIVPIMYKQRVSAVAAWRNFLALFARNLGYFLLFGIIKFLLDVCVIICVVVLGLLTCCVGFIVLLIPYINSVILLPISYTFRAFGVEFIEQFGDEYKIFSEIRDEETINPDVSF